MKTLLRCGPVALVAAFLVACQVGRLLHPSGDPNGPPADSSAARVTFSTQPNDAGVGQAITPPVSVVITDSAGHPVPGYSGSVTLSLGANATGATLSGPNTATATNGVATFSGLSVNKAGSGYTLTAASSGLAAATSAPFDVTSAPAPPATHVAFISQPGTTRAGDPIAPAVQVAAEDSTGAVVSTYTGAITVAIGANSTGGTLSGSRVIAANRGIATFSTLSIDKAGLGYTLTASASGLTPATSATFDITAPPPPPPMATALTFTGQPQSAQTGASLGTVTVAAVDSTGAAVSDFSGTITIAIGANPSGGTLSGTTAVATSGGIATFSDLSIDKAGTGYTLSASTLGLTNAVSATFSVTAPSPTTGSLTVTTTTTGSNLDADGYTATVDGGASQAIGDNASVTFANLSAAGHTVVLSGLASNCAVGNASQTVTIPAGGTASAAFAISCAAPPPTTGSLTATTTTTGSNLDPDGYSVSVDGGGSQPIGDNGSVTFSNLTAGSHTVTLSGLASNCSAGSTSQSVSVPAGGSTSASFSITCQASPPPTNQPPVVNAGGNQSQLVSVLYQLNASFTDPDGAGDGPWSYSINWGDGTSSSGTLSAQGAIGPSHTYVLPGAYTITVTVTDARGASGTDSKTLNVTL